MVIPLSFFLTINNLQLRCGTKWYRVVKQFEIVGLEAEKEQPVGIRPKSAANNPNRTRLTRFCVLLTSGSVVAEILGDKKRRLRMTRGDKKHVSSG